MRETKAVLRAVNIRGGDCTTQQQGFKNSTWIFVIQLLDLVNKQYHTTQQQGLKNSTWISVFRILYIVNKQYHTTKPFGTNLFIHFYFA